MATHPTFLGLTLDPTLTYSTHIHNISVKAHKPLQMIKALTSTESTWSPIAFFLTIINKLQIMQNAALRLPQDAHKTQTDNIYMAKPSYFPYTTATRVECKQKTQHPSNHLHKHTTYFNTPTIFNNGRLTTNIPLDTRTVTTTDIKTNMRHIHRYIVSRHLATRDNSPPHSSHPCPTQNN